MMFSWKTDAAAGDIEAVTAAAAVFALIAQGEWAQVGSLQESRDIDDGAFLRVFHDGGIVFERSAARRDEIPGMQQAEDWYNATPKAQIIEWATAVGLDIGQARERLDEDWNERVIVERASRAPCAG